jgi:tryptophan synthase alpha subunit
MQVAKVASIADGVVVGSAIINLLEGAGCGDSARLK